METIPMTVVEYARAQHAAGDYAGAWKTLSQHGDSYADNAYAVVGRPKDGFGDLFGNLVENHWENTAPGAYDEKFQEVARAYQDKYLTQLEDSGGTAPDEGVKIFV